MPTKPGHVSDVLLTTPEPGPKTSVDRTFGQHGPESSAGGVYKVNVENLSSGLAIMTANGIATAEATTYTKSMLNRLGDFGGSTVGESQRDRRGFAELMDSGRAWATCCRCCMTAWAAMPPSLRRCGQRGKPVRVRFRWPIPA